LHALEGVKAGTASSRSSLTGISYGRVLTRRRCRGLGTNSRSYHLGAQVCVHQYLEEVGKTCVGHRRRSFPELNLEQRYISYGVLDSSETERGMIWYDIKASEGLNAERCVVVGRESELRNKKYCILVVRPTSAGD
jgi:hypothetical protein